MQSQNHEWKKAILEKWDQECYHSNGEYTKRKASGVSSDTGSGNSDPTNEVVHIVTPGDTIEGLSLFYNVPIHRIKHRNNIETNQIYYRTEIIIPDPKVVTRPSRTHQRQEKMDYLIRKLKLTHDDEGLVRKILEETSWNVNNAIKKYNTDLEWEQKYADILCSFENNKKRTPFLDSGKGNTV